MRRNKYIIAFLMTMFLNGESLKIGALEFGIKDASVSFKEDRSKIVFSIGDAKLKLSKLNADLNKRRRKVSFDLASSSLQLKNIELGLNNNRGDLDLSFGTIKMDVRGVDFSIDSRERVELEGFKANMLGKKLAITFSGVFSDEFQRESGLDLESFVLQNASADLIINDFGEVKFNLKGKSSIAAISVNAELGIDLEELNDEPSIEKLVVVISSLSKEAKAFVKEYNKRERNEIPYKNGKITLDFSKRKIQKLFD